MTAAEFWSGALGITALVLGFFYLGIFVGRLLERADRRGRRTRSGDHLG